MEQLGPGKLPHRSIVFHRRTTSADGRSAIRIASWIGGFALLVSLGKI